MQKIDIEDFVLEHEFEKSKIEENIKNLEQKLSGIVSILEGSDVSLIECEKVAIKKVREVKESLVKEIKSKEILKDVVQRYKRINPSFLNIANILSLWKAVRIPIPRFGVYTIKDGFNSFKLKYPIKEYGKRILGKPKVLYEYYDTDNQGHSWMSKFPEVLEEGITRNFYENYDNNNSHGFLGRWRSRRIIRTWRGDKIESIYAGSEFNGILPSEVKWEIDEAKKCFKENIFLIAEVPIESWEFFGVSKPKKVTKDPLILGVHENKAYLVKSFNTTYIEDYVKTEFLE